MSNRNVFLVARLVFFAVFLVVNLFSAVGAAWNIGTTGSLNIPATATALFIIMDSLLSFNCIMAAYAYMAFPTSRTAIVKVELIWTAIATGLQLGGSVSATINGPPVFCRSAMPWEVCASSSLLIPTTWLSTIMILAYCLSLLAVTAAHSHKVEDIWGQSIHKIDWFGEEARSYPKWLPEESRSCPKWIPEESFAKSSPTALEKARVARPIRPCEGTLRFSAATGSRTPSYIPSTTLGLENLNVDQRDSQSERSLFSETSCSEESTRPQWAKDMAARRGVDQPFGGASRIPLKVQENTSARIAPKISHSRFSFETLASQAYVVSSGHSRRRPGNPMEQALVSSTTLPLPPVRPAHSRQNSEQRRLSSFPDGVDDEDMPIPIIGYDTSSWVVPVDVSPASDSILSSKSEHYGPESVRP